MHRKLPIKRAKPTVDAVRKRLGGRASTDPDAGDVVALRSTAGIDTLGVVLFAKGDELDVWTAGTIAGIVRRTHRTKVTPAQGEVPRTLTLVAKDARVFAQLSEGSRVRFATEAGEVGEGTLVEKCRYGGLLLRDDGSIIGVGFRRLWPSSGSRLDSN